MSGLYLECNAGISGDMAVAALLDAGADRTVLQAALDSIPAQGFRTEVTRVKKNGIDCCDFAVILDEAHENHDHDMHYLFGHEAGGYHGEHRHGHSHEEDDHDGEVHHHHAHEHEHEHSHGEEAHHHEHRNLSDVLAIIDKTQMTDGARKLARKIFQIIAETESAAHGVPLDEVHFHEVGAIDSIVDVIALAVCFDNLAPGRVYVPSLNEGTGTVRCQHGILPIPVPAVADIAARYKLPLHIMNAHGEFITPTGAAFVAAVMTDTVLPAQFTVQRIGLGAGKRSYERPSIVRAMLIEADSQSNFHADAHGNERLFKLETNIDDCTGEALGFVMEELFAAGANDVHYIPCVMKKSRPAYLLSVLCREADISRMEEIIFTHTTTIGIRRYAVERTVLAREKMTVRAEHGDAEVKRVTLPDGEKRFYPEYESVAKIARAAEKPFGEVYREIVDLCLSANQ